MPTPLRSLVVIACFTLVVATATLFVDNVHAVTIDMVTVGDAGNLADDTGYGAVPYEYRIGKYEVTIGQYVEFLNAVAKTDIYGLYNESMRLSLATAGVSRSGTWGAYTYIAIGPSGASPPGASSAGNRPITYVSWFDAARFANWMHNGQGSGSTETGAYTLNGATFGPAPARNPGAAFYIPTENEWYKAAYYKGGSLSAGYWDYATQSNSTPGNVIGSSANQANYYAGVYAVTQIPNFSPTSSQNYLTDVGAFTGSPSAYNTFDQSGNAWEWNDLTGEAGTWRGLRGGAWNANSFSSSSANRAGDAPDLHNSLILGFRLASPVAVPEPSTWVLGAGGLACAGWGAWRRRKRSGRVVIWPTSLALATTFLSVGSAHAVTIDMVTVGDPGNAADTTGYGAVNYEYRIGKYEVTIGQYVAFLNSVAKEDPRFLYHPYMFSEEETAGIRRTGVSGSYSYSSVQPWGIVPAGADSADNRPIAWVSWFDAARFANWMSNGQPIGPQGPTTTENGAYDLVTAPPALAPAINALNPNTGAVPLYRIPTENEWYKAAYYKGGSANAGYWKYATQSDSPPGNLIGSGINQVNCMVGQGVNSLYSVTQATFNINVQQNYLTNVGAFTGSPSFYGTFDQSGNVHEWNDLRGDEGLRAVRGGYYGGVDSAYTTSSEFRNSFNGETQGVYGFRLAAPAVVPEPSSFCMALAGLTCGGYSMWRRRVRVPTRS